MQEEMKELKKYILWGMNRLSIPGVKKVHVDGVMFKIKDLLQQQHQEDIEKIEGMKKKGLEEIIVKDGDESFESVTCKECGGYDECDCGGYNQAITDVLNTLKDK